MSNISNDVASTKHRKNVESLRFATLKAINLHAGRNIEHSRRIVDESDIDTKGFLRITNVIGAAPPRRS